ncbi:helix-turn-helix transcriptional regulator [Nocardia sp. NBC_01503]|uniref:winged helix-turn-helix transcriptional regulator n=1 Tax=Nocardia sp. NBC_01503 TaxID=2975997 RepID=UPI002E7BE6CC|nr:helix-turn-helix domain-containing protein [Nocardia sp. NBC_01503]WTL35135.1 helix-turn-helix transcriptional regulator [Nocardia sp. NBC_01503]
MSTPDPETIDPTLEADVFARNCASRPVLQDVASRWGALALVALREGPTRFSALRRRVDGISERMLSQTLQNLERDGMIHREVQQSIPPHVEYTLTDLGENVADQLAGLIDILESNLERIVAAQNAYHRD